MIYCQILDVLNYLISTYQRKMVVFKLIVLRGFIPYLADINFYAKVYHIILKI